MPTNLHAGHDSLINRIMHPIPLEGASRERRYRKSESEKKDIHIGNTVRLHLCKVDGKPRKVVNSNVKFDYDASSVLHPAINAE